LPRTAFESWGWRLPFLLGIEIAFVGFYIRHYTEESPHYEKAKHEGALSQSPVRKTMRLHLGKLVRGVGIYLSVTVPFYTLTVFLNGFLSGVLGHTIKDALLISTLSMILLMLLVVPTAALSDRWGRKRMLMATAVVYFVASYPLFWLMTQPGFLSPLMAAMLLTVIVGFYIGPAPTVFVELFPTSVRYTGMAISYNMSAALFGGTAPIVETWMIKEAHGMNTIPAFYLMLCAALSFIAFIGYHDRYQEELR
jgi:MFS transporter, MHS family, proline/betaine transporter